MRLLEFWFGRVEHWEEWYSQNRTQPFQGSHAEEIADLWLLCATQSLQSLLPGKRYLLVLKMINREILDILFFQLINPSVIVSPPGIQMTVSMGLIPSEKLLSRILCVIWERGQMELLAQVMLELGSFPVVLFWDFDNLIVFNFIIFCSCALGEGKQRLLRWTSIAFTGNRFEELSK